MYFLEKLLYSRCTVLLYFFTTADIFFCSETFHLFIVLLVYHLNEQFHSPTKAAVALILNRIAIL